MCVIGLTGSLGTGKSTVAKMFAGLGAKVIDADAITHRLMRPKAVCFRKVVTAFGGEILKGERIDRKELAQRVFRNARELRKLQKIIHPEVRKVIIAECKEIKKQKRNAVVVIDVPLLFETKLDRHADISIVVKAGRPKQIARATKVMGITKAEAERRIKAQMPLRKKIRLADIIIDNNGTINQTKKQVIRIWDEL